MKIFFKYIILPVAGCLFGGVLQAQPKNYYESPVKIPVFLSGNVGELRGSHFHSGIDIKTQGVTGKPVYSVADGYVSRVAVSPWGYGHALYIAHKNGTTSVYGHLDRFAPEIEKYVREQQYKRKSFSVDLYPDKSLFPLSQGDLVAYSGNTGSSGGPHLHFEIRDGRQQAMNVLAAKIMSVEDTIPPRIVTLYYVTVDTVGGIPVHTTRAKMPVKKSTSWSYTVGDGTPVKVAPNGYFAVEIAERKNGTANTFGIYSINMNLDSEPVFGYSLDKINFSTTRYSQAVAKHPEAKGNRNGVYRLAVLPNNPLPVYRNVADKGVIRLGDSEVHNVAIDVADENGNSTTLVFDIRNGLEAAVPDVTGEPVMWNKDFTYSDSGLTVNIPAKSLYESILFTSEVKPEPAGGYSSLYRVHKASEPLQGNITVSIDASALPEHLRGKALIASVGAGGRKSSAGGAWKNGVVETKTRSFGSYYIAVDTVAPRITPSFKSGENFASRRSISFVISDDFSGIEKYDGMIDGEWVLFEYEPMKNRITHRFDKPGTGGKHTISLVVEDGKGNKKTFDGSFVR